MITVIYEESCGFCNWCRRFVERRAQVEIDFIDYDSVEAHKLLAAFPELMTQRKTTIIVFSASETPSTKYQACRTIAYHMRRPWPSIAKILGIVPTFIGDLGYDLIATMRPVLSRLVVRK